MGQTPDFKAHKYGKSTMLLLKIHKPGNCGKFKTIKEDKCYKVSLKVVAIDYTLLL